jgi:hypothetical protein
MNPKGIEKIRDTISSLKPETPNSHLLLSTDRIATEALSIAESYHVELEAENSIPMPAASIKHLDNIIKATNILRKLLGSPQSSILWLASFKSRAESNSPMPSLWLKAEMAQFEHAALAPDENYGNEHPSPWFEKLDNLSGWLLYLRQNIDQKYTKNGKGSLYTRMNESPRVMMILRCIDLLKMAGSKHGLGTSGPLARISVAIHFCVTGELLDGNTLKRDIRQAGLIDKQMSQSPG